jgi:hypothetical protein
MTSKKIIILSTLTLFTLCALQGSVQHKNRGRTHAAARPKSTINALSLVQSVQQYLKDLADAKFFINESARTKASTMLGQAREKLNHAKRVLEHIGRMAIAGHSPEEVSAYQQYATQSLQGLPIGELIPTLHEKREAVKAAYRKAEEDLDVQKEKKIKFELISPAASGPKKSKSQKHVTFAPDVKPE